MMEEWGVSREILKLKKKPNKNYRIKKYNIKNKKFTQ